MRWECHEKACFISCRTQLSVCFILPNVKIIVLESAPGPSLCTDAGFAALGAARSGTSDIDHRKPGVCGVHDLDNTLIGYRAVESELFGFLIQQGWLCHFPSDKSRSKVCEIFHRVLDQFIWGCPKYKPNVFPRPDLTGLGDRRLLCEALLRFTPCWPGPLGSQIGLIHAQNVKHGTCVQSSSTVLASLAGNS